MNRLLYVDPDEAASEQFGMLLGEIEGVTIEHRSGIREGIAFLQQSDVHCIVSKFHLPGSNGIEFFETVRTDFPQLPFILYTDDASDEMIQEALDAGVTDIIQKVDRTPHQRLVAHRILQAIEQSSAIRETERFRRLSETFPDVLLYIDKDGRHLDVLAGSANLVFDEADLIGHRLQDVHRDDIADRLHQTVNTAIETGEVQMIEYLLDTGPVQKWSEARVVPVDRLSSDRQAVLWASRDISARKEQEQQIKRYWHLVNAMEDPVAIYDTDACFRVTTDLLADRYGSTPDELEGTKSELIAQLRAEMDGDPYQELIDGDRDELLFTMPSPSLGEDAIMEYRFTRLMIDGECEGAVCVSRDVTDRKQRERELERQNQRLEEFATVVSHDLRNPLNVARGALELAMESTESEYLETATRAHDRMD